MTSKYIHTRLIAISLAVGALLAGCTDEAAIGRTDGGSHLVATKGSPATRADIGAFFADHTVYRFWLYQHSDDFSGAYSFTPADQNGVHATESASVHFVSFANFDNQSEIKGNVDIVGFTDCSVDPTESESSAAAQFVAHPGGSAANPTYEIRYHDPGVAAEAAESYGYSDYCRAQAHYNQSDQTTESDVIVGFKHILSKINVQMTQVSTTARAAGYDLTVKSIALKGVRDNATYNVRRDEFAIDASESRTTRTIWQSASADGTDILSSSQQLVSTYVLPSLDAADQDGAYLELEIELGGADAGQFTDADGKILVPVWADGQENVPLRFESNYEYTLQVVFMADGIRIVTVTPLVYPWFDGETDGGDKGDMYEDIAIGNPQLFDDLLWSDRDLGATQSLPYDSISFKACNGYFYQHGRNIPYLPVEWVDGGKNPSRNFIAENGGDVFPICPERVLLADGTYVNINLMNQAPWSGKGSGFLLTPDEIPDKILTWTLQYCKYNSDRTWLKGTSAGKDLWADPSTQPVPPGWRLPHPEDFYGIVPSTTYAGNLTFLRNHKHNNNGTGGNNSDTLKTDVVYVHVPRNAAYPCYPDKTAYMQDWLGPDGDPDQNPSGDPVDGYSSEYVLSKRYPKEDHVGKPSKRLSTSWLGYDAPWGSIYCIKKVGTQEAYRLRIHVEDVGGGVFPYYVLVISRYSASATDRLLYMLEDKDNKNYYMNYDWDHPVATLSLPITGLVGSENWLPGKMANLGTETRYGTTDYEGNFGINFSIKIGGDNTQNQFLCIARDNFCLGVHLRLVRDVTYQTKGLKSKRNAWYTNWNKK